MAPAPQAVLLALDLVRTPLLAPAVRRQPLPKGVLELIKIAAGCTAACRRAVAATGEREERIKEAAIFYLQHALLFKEADSYRVLGVARNAPQETVREHMRWLMRWLHPDRNASEWETAFAGRVLRAWDDVKTPSRRARYDALKKDRARAAGGSWKDQTQQNGRLRPVGLPLVAMPVAPQPTANRRADLVMWILAVIVGLTVFFTPWPNLSSLWASKIESFRWNESSHGPVAEDAAGEELGAQTEEVTRTPSAGRGH